MTTREDLLSRLARARALRDAAPGVLRLMIGDDDSESVVEYSGPLGKWSVTDSVDDRVAAFLAASHDHVQLAEDLAAALEQAEEERDRMARMLATASAFEVSPMTVKARQLGSIRVERCGQLEGPDLWAVRQRGNVLRVDGMWEYEPIPSSRDDDFMARFRFATLDAALEAANAALEADRAR